MKKIGMIDAPFKYDAFIERMAKQGAVVEFAQDKSEAGLIEFCKDKDVLACTFTKVTAPVLNATEHCSMIIRPSISARLTVSSNRLPVLSPERSVCKAVMGSRWIRTWCSLRRSTAS